MTEEKLRCGGSLNQSGFDLEFEGWGERLLGISKK